MVQFSTSGDNSDEIQRVKYILKHINVKGGNWGGEFTPR